VTKEICIKRIREERLAAPGAVDAFVREARLSARLAHPNIVPVFDFGRSEDQYYLAMEWIDGLDLRALVDRGEPLEDYVVAYIVAEVARALAYAHEDAPDAPIVHRDVKPANVLISRNGDVHLGDFGVATFDGQAEGIAGTPGFMAPEVGEGTTDVRSDLYSLGKLLGSLGADREPLSEIAAQLASSPDERPSASEVAERLETYVAQIRGSGARAARSLLAGQVAAVANALEPASGAGEAFEHHTVSMLHEPEATVSTAAPRVEERASSTPRRARRRLGASVGLAMLAGVGMLALGLGSRSAAKRGAVGKPQPSEQHPPAASSEPRSAPSIPPVEPSEPSASIRPDAPTSSGTRPSSSRARRSVAVRRALRVARAPAAEPVDQRVVTGQLSINAIPWARVSIDGIERGSTPLLGIELPAGPSHRVVLVNDVLGANAERAIVLEPGEARRVIVDLRATRQGQASASAQTNPTP